MAGEGYRTLRPHIGFAGILGFLLGLVLSVASRVYLGSVEYDASLLGLMGVGLSIAVSLLFSPVYIALAGHRYGRAGVVIESMIAQLLVFLVSWSVIFHAISR